MCPFRPADWEVCPDAPVGVTPYKCPRRPKAPGDNTQAWGHMGHHSQWHKLKSKVYHCRNHGRNDTHGTSQCPEPLPETVQVKIPPTRVVRAWMRAPKTPKVSRVGNVKPLYPSAPVSVSACMVTVKSEAATTVPPNNKGDKPGLGLIPECLEGSVNDVTTESISDQDSSGGEDVQVSPAWTSRTPSSRFLRFLLISTGWLAGFAFLVP